MVAVVKRLRHRIVAPAYVGSIPISHPIIFKILGYSQVGKAPDFDSGIRWFESSYPSHYDPLAQLVEHLTFNQGVPRSSRGWVTKIRRHSQVVRQRSAKPLFPSSNLGAASIFYINIYALIAQLDRVSDYESEGREFESLWAHQK